MITEKVYQNYENSLKNIVNVLQGYNLVSFKNFTNFYHDLQIGESLGCNEETLEALRKILLNINVIGFATPVKKEIAEIKAELAKTKPKTLTR